MPFASSCSSCVWCVRRLSKHRDHGVRYGLTQIIKNCGTSVEDMRGEYVYNLTPPPLPLPLSRST